MRPRYVILLSAALACAGAGCAVRYLGSPPPDGVSLLLLLAAPVLLAVAVVLLSQELKGARAETAALTARMETQRQEAEAALLDLQVQSEHQIRREVESFRSSLSHSVRVPLSIIQGYAELLCGGLVPNEDTRMEYLNKIVQRSHYMSNILSRQISEARSEADIVLSTTDLELVGMLRQAAEDFQTGADLRGIHIQVLSTQGQVELVADSLQLTKAFYNLVENSVKYMGREGMITIRVWEENGTARIIFQDDGLGLDAEEARHIFEPGYQGSNRSGGHGHGLYLVRRIIQAHGGEVSAESSPGLGMSILITLPIVPETDPFGPEPEPLDTGEAVPPVQEPPDLLTAGSQTAL